MSRLSAFLRELRHRRVFRTAGLYIVGVLITLQIANLTFDTWGFSSQASRYVYICAVLGLPLAVLFGWLYDLTPQGLVRNQSAKSGQSVDLSLQRSDFVILASLIVVAGTVMYGLAQRILESESIVESSFIHVGDIPPQSVAVLPFADMSAAEVNFPELFSEKSASIDRTNFRAAVDLAQVLQRVGEHDRAQLLLHSSLKFIETIPRLGASGYQVKDAEILAMLGQDAEALAALQQAVDQGWRRFWWYTGEHESNLDAVRARPEFQAMTAWLRADMAARLARVQTTEVQ